MSSSVSVYSYAHSVTYVAGQMLRSLKVIIVAIGLDPSKLTNQWEVIESGLKVWMNSKHIGASQIGDLRSPNRRFRGRMGLHH